MVTVTEVAKRHLKNILRDETTDPEIGFRLDYSAATGAILRLGKENADDYVIEHQGSMILLIDEKISEYVGPLTMDFTNDDSESPGLIISSEQLVPVSV